MELVKKKKTKMNRNKITDMIFYICLIAFPLIQFSIFYIGVNGNSFLMAFQDYSGDTPKFIGFDNFTRLFHDLKSLPVFKYAIRNSFIAYVVGLVFGMGSGLAFSYYIYKKMPMGNLFKVVLFAPSVISAMIIVILYSYFVNDYIPAVLQNIFGKNILGFLTNKETRFATVLIYNVIFGFGGSMLMYLSAMNNISTSIIEAAQMDGVGPFREFFQIILPQVFSTISVFLITGLAGIFTNQIALFSFFGLNNEPRYYTIGYYLYYKVKTLMSYSEYPYLSALGMVITTITLPIVLFFRWLFNRIDPMND